MDITTQTTTSQLIKETRVAPPKPHLTTIKMLNNTNLRPSHLPQGFAGDLNTNTMSSVLTVDAHKHKVP